MRIVVLCFLLLSLLSCLIFLQTAYLQRVLGGTYSQSWYLGESTENVTPADVNIIYTYPNRVESGEPFHVGVILQYVNDVRARSSWIMFSNVSISLGTFVPKELTEANGTKKVVETYNPTEESESNASKAVVKGESYLHSFSLYAPTAQGDREYLVFLRFHAIFSPEGVGEPYYDFDGSSDYNSTNAGGGNGNIAPTELPPMLVTHIVDQANSKEGRLIVEVEEPYGIIRAIPVTIGNVITPSHTCNSNPTNKTSNPHHPNPFKVFNITRSSEIRLIYGNHTVSVPRVVNIDKYRIQAAFSGWSNGQHSNCTFVNVTRHDVMDLFAHYNIQYYLSVGSNSSLLGFRVPTEPTGIGWYNAGTEAQFGVNPSLMFLFAHSFNHWKTNNYTILTSGYNDPAGSLNMDGPKQITALWKLDYTYLSIIIGIVAVAVPVLRKFSGTLKHHL